MKKLLYILFYITLISCNSKTEEIKEEVVVFSSDGTIIYESDVYEVINALFTDNEKTNILDGIDYSGELLSVYPNSDYIHTEELGMLDIVMEEDKDFIFKQVTRSEEHTSELQSREISYAVFCLKKKKILIKNSD